MNTPAPLRAVLVGCGSMSTAWLNAIMKMPNVLMVGLVDVVEEVARKKAADYGLDVAIGTHLVRVLEQTRPDIVFDCSIPEAHYSVTLDALRHGCHVLGEKPMADSMERAREMVAVAQETGKTYAVIQNRRYMAEIRQVRNALSQRVIGPLTTVNSDFYIGAHFGGFRDHMPHVLLLDMAIHTFDAARFLTQADPISVYCKEWNPQESWYDRDASAIAIFEMSNGLVYTYRGSWCAEGMSTSWEACWRFIGTDGSILWDGGEGIKGQVVKQKGGFISTCENITIPPYQAHGDIEGHASLIREFVSCIQQGTTPGTVCTDNIKSLAMVFGAIESAETGRAVDIHW